LYPWTTWWGPITGMSSTIAYFVACHGVSPLQTGAAGSGFAVLTRKFGYSGPLDDEADQITLNRPDDVLVTARNRAMKR
ncbi:hypothetical protein, partial [Methylobacterium trifolii]|uniref:hypothetical protein n=1 Tax=Methylobacterium trifolii TaxID=1003092 RepID=UPI001EE01D45